MTSSCLRKYCSMWSEAPVGTMLDRSLARGGSDPRKKIIFLGAWRHGVRTGTLTMLFAAIAAMIFMSPTVAYAQLTHNILMIHGRTDKLRDGNWGVFTYDQLGYWIGSPTTVDGHVYYVQWDAFDLPFDDFLYPGGYGVIRDAINSLCDFNNNQECWVICHSAGCAAFESYLASSDYALNTIFIAHVMAAGSAAGGTELATFSPIPIDNSLTTEYARNAYDHNNMQGVVVRGIGGTGDGSPGNQTINCAFFPSQSPLNPDCTVCPNFFGGDTAACADGAVALHSSCGHNRVASFQDCNSTLYPHSDIAGTYLYHGWWITDQECNGQGGAGCNWSGPYSPNTNWNADFKTYFVGHSGTANNAIAEYSYAPYSLCP